MSATIHSYAPGTLPILPLDCARFDFDISPHFVTCRFQRLSPLVTLVHYWFSRMIKVLLLLWVFSVTLIMVKFAFLLFCFIQSKPATDHVNEDYVNFLSNSLFKLKMISKNLNFFFCYVPKQLAVVYNNVSKYHENITIMKWNWNVFRHCSTMIISGTKTDCN